MRRQKVCCRLPAESGIPVRQPVLYIEFKSVRIKARERRKYAGDCCYDRNYIISIRLKEFANEFQFGEGDLVITNEYIYQPYFGALNLKCDVLYQERYGKGELMTRWWKQ